MSSAISSPPIDELLMTDLILPNGTLPDQELALIIAFKVNWKLLQASQSLD